jgi:hypothetical protein
VSGAGEGVVWYPVSLEDKKGTLSMNYFSAFAFKTKGKSHMGVYQSASVQIEPEVVHSPEEFADMFLQPARKEQGVLEGCNGEFKTELLQSFVDWMLTDIKKESVVELEASNLSWDKIENVLRTRCTNWYNKKIKSKRKKEEKELAAKAEEKKFKASIRKELRGNPFALLAEDN